MQGLLFYTKLGAFVDMNCKITRTSKYLPSYKQTAYSSNADRYTVLLYSSLPTLLFSKLWHINLNKNIQSQVLNLCIAMFNP